MNRGLRRWACHRSARRSGLGLSSRCGLSALTIHFVAWRSYRGRPGTYGGLSGEVHEDLGAWPKSGGGFIHVRGPVGRSRRRWHPRELRHAPKIQGPTTTPCSLLSRNRLRQAVPFFHMPHNVAANGGIAVAPRRRGHGIGGSSMAALARPWRPALVFSEPLHETRVVTCG